MFENTLERTDALSECNNDVNSEIQSYFAGKKIFVTGVTGSLGKLIVEKLLRSCMVTMIYVLVREKKGKSPEERVKDIFEMRAFEPLRKQMPNFEKKISLCIGDCLHPNLGLSEEDIKELKDNVQCVVHCAATVRFDAPLRKAVYINVRATRDLLRIAKEMKHLTSFVHVSTAYSFCPKQEIDETFYEPPITESKLMCLVEALEDDVLDAVTATVIKEWPNTYSFTKAVAEDVVRNEGKELPVSIIRPSMIVPCLKEPMPGWIDTFYGVVAVFLAGGIGALRVIPCDKRKNADAVPMDYVVNATIAVAWNNRKKTTFEQADAHGVPVIYNYVSGNQNPITWERSVELGKKYWDMIPTVLALWALQSYLIKNLRIYSIINLFVHAIPAYFADFILYCIGRKTLVVSLYKKFANLSDKIAYFATRDWIFKDTNVQDLWKNLNANDKEMFEFDIKMLDWEKYMQIGTVGGRIYLLKDPMDTLPQAKRKQIVLKIAHYTLLTFLCLLLFILIKYIFGSVF